MTKYSLFIFEITKNPSAHPNLLIDIPPHCSELQTTERNGSSEGSKTDNAWACDKIIWWGAWYAANWVVACDVCVYQKRKLLSKEVRNAAKEGRGSRLVKSICTMLSMWPCTLKSGEERSTYAGLAQKNGFSPAYLVRLVTSAAKLCTCYRRV